MAKSSRALMPSEPFDSDDMPADEMPRGVPHEHLRLGGAATRLVLVRGRALLQREELQGNSFRTMNAVCFTSSVFSRVYLTLTLTIRSWSSSNRNKMDIWPNLLGLNIQSVEEPFCKDLNTSRRLQTL